MTARAMNGPVISRTEPEPELSVVVPVYNESGNLMSLIDEILLTLRGRMSFEIIYVDDASNDDTGEILGHLARRIPELYVVTHLRQSGQSAALWTGVDAARARRVATLDGDGQNNPADIPALLDHFEAAGENVKLVSGWRTQRQDNVIRRLSSRIANRVRQALLRDATPDTGCGIKVFDRDAFMRLPRFRNMHRYLPALMKRDGWKILSVPVSHRPRRAGRSKYGVWNRLWVGIHDLVGVAWLLRRPVAVSSFSLPKSPKLAPPNPMLTSSHLHKNDL